MQITERMRGIKPFHVMELMARAQALEREGRDIVHMEIGEPDFPTPPVVAARAVEYIRAGMVGYTPAGGLSELREAISKFYRFRYQISVPARRIFITPGASGAFLLVLGALVDAGDRVLLADPGYPCYANVVRLFGGKPHHVPVDVQSGFQLDSASVKQSWTGRTAGVVLASPSNPTGTMIDKKVLGELVAVVDERQGFLVSDEIYHGLEYNQPSHSALEFSDQAFVVNSFSKYFGMTGWRLGWLIVPESHVQITERLAQNVFISAAAPSQAAALAAFDPQNLEELERRRLEFHRRRDYLLTEVRRLGFEVPLKPEGAFYIYADCSGWTQESFDFAWRLLEQASVAVTPGRDFGLNQPERYVRFSYTTSMERLALGISRITQFLGV